MSLFFQYSPLLLLVCAVIAAAAVVWGYRRTVPDLPRGRKALLGSLRFASFFLICFLLFEPIARRTTNTSEEPVLAVLLDDSESVLLATEGQPALQSRGVREVAEALALPADAEIRAFRFSTTAIELDADPEALSDSMRFDGERTDIAEALTRVRERLQDEHLAGVVLISDGRYNTGSNPLYVAERSSVPIHTIVVGDTTAQRDVVVDRVSANRIAYVGVEQPVEVDLRVNGFPGERLSVSLAANGQTVGTATVDVTGEVVQVPVQLTYVPGEAGLGSLAVSVTTLEGELTHQNNRAVVPVRVLDEKRQVILLAGAPDPDVAAVRQILQNDDNIELTVRVQKDASSFYEGSLPSSFDAYDALVLVGFPGPATTASSLRVVRQAVEGGVPLLYVMSRSTNLALLASELGDVLPASTNGNRAGWIEAMPRLTPEGTQHPIFSSPDAAPADWQRLPPVRVSESRWVASPDSRVLATTEVRGVALDDPMIAVRTRGGVRSAAVLGAGTWRWKNVPSDLDDVATLWPDVLANALQWITAARDQRPVRVNPVHEMFAGGEGVSFEGEVYDESMRPLADAQVEVDVVSDDGRSIPLRLESSGNGRYTARDVSLPEGTYTYEAVASRGDVRLGTDSGSFTVGGLTLEHRDTRADPALMRQLAARSGGHAFSADEASDVARVLQNDASLAPRTASIVSESNLRRRPIFLLLIVVLLTTEWILRKRSGLV